MAYPCDILDPKQTSYDVFICGHGQELHLHRPVLLQARLWPVLDTRLKISQICITLMMV